MAPRPHSLRRRVSLVFAVGTSVVLVVVLVGFYALLDGQLRRAQAEGLEVRFDRVSAAVLAGDVAVVARDPLAQYYAPDGRVLAGSAALASARLLSPAQVLRAETRGTTIRLDLETAGASELRVFSGPVGDGGGTLGVAVAGGPVLKVRGYLFEVLIAASVLLVALVAASVWRTARAALAPVDRLTREAEAISTLEPSARLTAVPGDDEIARLAGTLGRMLDRLHVAFARERAFVDDASHELRTPIAVMRGELELARAAADAGDATGLDRALSAATIENERLARLAENLLLLAREGDGHREPAVPVDLLDLAWAEVRRQEPVLAIAMTVTGDPAVVPGDPFRLRQVLANLLLNAAAAGARTVEIRITEGQTQVEVRVADDGPGFEPSMLLAAFERFARGDAARTRTGGGAGLGLAIVRAVVTGHGGTTDLANGPPLGGAVVTFRLPLADPGA